mmetsp:Transcript_48667/g.122455  ORF Transcript_48667/g.122455 Transcript_48667/m.122455 type:complete len:475 (+) Transcript_48667:251-1675(+)
MRQFDKIDETGTYKEGGYFFSRRRLCYAGALVSLLLLIVFCMVLLVILFHSFSARRGSSGEGSRYGNCTAAQCAFLDRYNAKPHNLSDLDFYTNELRTTKLTVLDMLAALECESPACHGKAHMLGWLAFKNEGEAIFPFIVPRCTGAALHGFAEAVADATPLDQLAAVTHRLCDPLGNDVGVCYHGFGHGFLMMNGSRAFALELCANIDERSGGRMACGSGVWMASALDRERLAFTSLEAVLATPACPCSCEPFPGACFLYSSKHLFRTTPLKWLVAPRTPQCGGSDVGADGASVASNTTASAAVPLPEVGGCAWDSAVGGAASDRAVALATQQLRRNFIIRNVCRRQDTRANAIGCIYGIPQGFFQDLGEDVANSTSLLEVCSTRVVGGMAGNTTGRHEPAVAPPLAELSPDEMAACVDGWVLMLKMWHRTPDSHIVTLCRESLPDQPGFRAQCERSAAYFIHDVLQDVSLYL